MHPMNNAISQSMRQSQGPGLAQPMALPAANQAWTPAHHFHRIHDPAGFAWLDGLPDGKTQATVPMGRCFGMDVAYVALDLLLWFPAEMVLAIPFLDSVPPEYFLACNASGQRWWCFVVLRKGNMPTALVFDVDPSVLLIAGLGLRETEVDVGTGAVTHRRDFGYSPNAAVLCSMDTAPIRYERLSPATREYFCIREVEGIGGTPTLADVLASRHQPLVTSAMEVSIGTPALGLRMRINEDQALVRYLDSLGASR
jgi:hypothetical protein